MNLVHNEQVKLLAGALNNVGVAMVAAGFIAPVSGYLYGSLSNASLKTIVVVSPIWLTLGVLLMSAARRVLKGLME